MKVTLLQSRVTATEAQSRGDVIDVSPDEGKRMIEAGQAAALRSAKPETTSAKKASEKAVK